MANVRRRRVSVRGHRVEAIDASALDDSVSEPAALHAVLDSIEAARSGRPQPAGDLGDDEVQERERADVAVERSDRPGRQHERRGRRWRRSARGSCRSVPRSTSPVRARRRHRVEHPAVVAPDVDHDHGRRLREQADVAPDRDLVAGEPCRRPAAAVPARRRTGVPPRRTHRPTAPPPACLEIAQPRHQRRAARRCRPRRASPARCRARSPGGGPSFRRRSRRGSDRRPGAVGAADRVARTPAGRCSRRTRACRRAARPSPRPPPEADARSATVPKPTAWGRARIASATRRSAAVSSLPAARMRSATSIAARR